MSSTPPDWFTRAVNAPVESRYVEVEGTPIHYLAWNPGDTHKPGLLFAHGFRAHARWWSFIAPFFLGRFRVAALDFAGMGDSGARPEYRTTLFAADILGVIKHAGFGKATLVGHSFGGGCTLVTCHRHSEHIERAVIIDSYLPLPEIELRDPRPPDQRAKRIYPTREAALARFRLIPEQNRAAPYVLDYVAQHSIKQVEGGWTWKFHEDYKFVRRPIAEEAQLVGAALSGLRMPMTYIYGDHSAAIAREHALAIVKRVPNGHGPVAIPESHHHVMLDQPLSLVSALRATLY